MKATLIVLALIASVGALFLWFPLESALELSVRWTSLPGLLGPGLFLVLYLLGAALVTPLAAVLTLLAGFLYGLGGGLLVICVANVAACALQWWIGRRWLRRWADAFVEKRPVLRALDNAAQADTARVVLLVRLAPIVPFGAVNYAAGARNWAPLPYFTASFVGLLTTDIGALYLGSVTRRTADLLQTPVQGEVVSTVLLVVGSLALLLLTAWIGRVALRALRLEDEKAAP